MTALNSQEIYLTKRSKVIVPHSTGEGCGSTVVATIQKNLESLGYVLSPGVCHRLSDLSPEAAAEWFRDLVTVLKRTVGAHRRYRPMYPNFPAQVMEASESELYLNAIWHYFGSAISDLSDDPTFVLLPRYNKEERKALTTDDEEKLPKLRVITLGDEDDFNTIFTALCSANSSISESDKAILTWFVERYKDGVRPLLPEVVPQKETLATLVGLALQHCEQPNFLTRLLKTATDVLRVAVVMSAGDVSLAKPTRFRRIKRLERRFLLRCLEENSGQIVEDMMRYQERWKRLGKELRPGDYSALFPKTYEAFNTIRNVRRVETFNSQVELALATGEIGMAVELLRQRPGIFARRLDHVLRIGQDFAAEIISDFLKVADKVSTPVLLQAYHHFKYRERQRAFIPKGNVAKMQIPTTPQAFLPEYDAKAVAGGIREVLVNRFRSLPALGNVWIDDKLQTQIVPFAMRAASKSLRTIARGSRMALPEGSTVRFFLWWKNGTGRTDIDLSAVTISPDFRYLGGVSYFNLRDGGDAAHSGDITNAPNGACEFIDMQIESMFKRGIGYVAMCINSFTHQPFCNLPECFAGWMMRSKPQSGEIFEARTVQDKVDLTADTQAAIPVIIDLGRREVVWTDMALTSQSLNNVYSSRGNLASLTKAIIGLNRPTLYDLFTMHAEARGTIVSEKEEANTVFGLYEGITPFDIDKIMSEFLGNETKSTVAV